MGKERPRFVFFLTVSTPTPRHLPAVQTLPEPGGGFDSHGRCARLWEESTTKHAPSKRLKPILAYNAMARGVSRVRRPLQNSMVLLWTDTTQ